MNRVLKKKLPVLLSAGMIAMLSACSDSSDVSGDNGGITDVTTNAAVSTLGSTVIESNDFSFPQVAEANEGFQVIIPEGGAVPEFPARRTLSAGSGNTIEFGDPVVLRYSMYSWSTGELIESTDNFDEAFTIQAGLSEGVPEFLSNSLLGRNIGDRIQVVFNAGMEDLPEYLDNTDAYVLIVDLI